MLVELREREAAKQFAGIVEEMICQKVKGGHACMNTYLTLGPAKHEKELSCEATQTNFECL